MDHPRSIPLNAHAVIRLDVGAPLVRAQPFAFDRYFTPVMRPDDRERSRSVS
jgi:hypothetical protein